MVRPNPVQLDGFLVMVVRTDRPMYASKHMKNNTAKTINNKELIYSRKFGGTYYEVENFKK